MEALEEKRKYLQSQKFPESAFSFYVKLYCKQKGSSRTKYQSKLIEATKSWLSLTEAQKQQVTQIYKEKEHKYKLKCFEQLKNAEPFMKIKDTTRYNNSCSEVQKPGLNIEDDTLQPEAEHVNHRNEDDIGVAYEEETRTNSDKNIGPDYELIEYNETVASRNESKQINEEDPRTVLVEPSPPTLKSSKDLFYMLNPSDGTNSTSWAAVPSIEKKQYSRAVCLLKKDYIAKYKEYLESLSPLELFNHYNKTLF